MPEDYEPIPLPHDMPAPSPNDVVLEDLVVPPDLGAVLLERANKAHLLVLPRRYSRVDLETSPELGERVPYADSDMRAVKILQRVGLDIDYLNDADERSIEAQLSADVIVAIGLFICQALAEEEIATIYRFLKARIVQAVAAARRPDVRPLAKVDLLKARSGDLSVEAKGISGPADQVVELTKQILQKINSQS